MTYKNIVPNHVNIFKKECKCYGCGRINYIALIPQDDYRFAYEKTKEHYTQLFTAINNAIEHIDKFYGSNPFKDRIVSELNEIRNKYWGTP